MQLRYPRDKNVDVKYLCRVDVQHSCNRTF
jgi:hypothetical protein